MLFGASGALAADVKRKPFVLASKGAGMVDEKIAQTKTALTGAGFSVGAEIIPLIPMRKCWSSPATS